MTPEAEAEDIVRGNMGLTNLSLFQASHEAERLEAAIAKALRNAEARGYAQAVERERRRLETGY